MDIHQELAQAAADGIIVRLRRKQLEKGWVDGYVAGVGPQLFVLEVIDDAIRLDGFHCYRLEDVTELTSPAPTSRFQARALALRGLTRRETPSFSVVGVSPLVQCARGVSRRDPAP